MTDRPESGRGNRLSGRIRRYARVTSTIGGLAAGLAGSRLFGIDIDRGRHAADLTRALGGLKGPLMKVAQIMSTIPDAVPREYARELASLQSNAPAMGWPFVRRRMAAELGPDWQAGFDSFDRQATAAASLGQVHRATRAGTPLACKLQYPDMESVVEADLKQLRIIFAIWERYDGAISTGEIHKEIAARLREELDYNREARHMELYASMLSGESGIHVPEAVPELCTRRLLTMSWLDGRPLLTAREDDQETRNRIALNMFRAWYVPFYEYGIIHGDPHLGNYSVRPGGEVNLLDFGCVRIFPTAFVRGVIDLYRALEQGDEDLAVHSYETWGFRDLDRETIRVLNQWAEFLYAPLLEDRIRPIDENNTGIFGADVVGRVHRELRRRGGVTPPREFVMMDRAAVGLGSVFMHLRAEINWHRLFHEMIGDFSEESMARRQRAALTAAAVPEVLE